MQIQMSCKGPASPTQFEHSYGPGVASFGILPRIVGN